MEKDYSIAEARHHLASLVHEVERGRPVRLTRRGKPVAVLVSLDDYEGRRGAKATLWDVVRKFRNRGGIKVSRAEIARWRDRTLIARTSAWRKG